MSPTQAEVEALAHKLRKQAVCVYLACEASVADDLAAAARNAATMLLTLREERDEALGRIGNALA